MSRRLRTYTIALLSTCFLHVSCTGQTSQPMDPSSPSEVSTASAPSATATATAPAPRFGPKLAAISYWSNEAEYDTLPAGAVGTINPQCGIVAVTDPVTIERYQRIVAKAKSRGVMLLGYVRTGYGQRKPGGYDCSPNGALLPQSLEEIQKQIDTYFAKVPALAGVFFDEVSYDESKFSCDQIKADIAAIRKLLRAKSGTATIAWNPGTVGPAHCYTEAADAGEVVAVFEKDYETYAGDKRPSYIDGDLGGAQEVARRRGVATWHLVHTTPADKLEVVLTRAKALGANYVFVTERADWSKGINTFGGPPIYWEREKEWLQ